MLVTILAVAVSYLVGGIPFGYLAGRILKGIDVRDYGSGNLGATNTLRILGPGPGIAVLILDAGKGVFSVLAAAGMANRLGPALDPFVVRALCAAAAIAGHDWPLFLRFRGGKGVATGLGVFMALAPLYTLASLALFLLAAFVTRHVSVGSLVLAASIPLLLLVGRKPAPYLGLAVFWLISVLFLHRENISRLLRGTERRLGEKPQASGEEQ